MHAAIHTPMVGLSTENVYQLRPGDIVHTWSESVVSQLIRIGSTHYGEDPTLASHTAMVAAPFTIIEAVAQGTVYNPVASLGTCAIFRIPNLTEGDRTSMALAASRYHGKKYPFVKVFVLHGIDWLFFHGQYVARRFAASDKPYCTSLIVAAGRAAESAEAHLPWDLDEVQPDDLLDYQVRRGHELVLVDSEATLEQLTLTYPSLEIAA